MGMLEGKVALITGGSRGQGRAHAITCAREGADVIIIDTLDQIASVAYPMAQQADIDETVLAAFCRERLADYKIPDRFVFTTDPLPRNANGKLMKAPLREQARTDAAKNL